MATLKRLSFLLFCMLCSCAAWKAGINDPNIVSHAIAVAQPYKQVADAVYPHAGIVVGAILIPLMILIDGWHKEKK